MLLERTRTKRVEEAEAAQSTHIVGGLLGGALGGTPGGTLGGGSMSNGLLSDGLLPGIIPGVPPMQHGHSSAALNLFPMFQQAAGAAQVQGGTATHASQHEREALAAQHLLQPMQPAAEQLASAAAKPVPGASPQQSEPQPQPPLRQPTDQATIDRLVESSAPFKRQQA